MTNNIKVQPVILCGGSGGRLWPLSRAGFPEQFLCLTGTDSLFQQALKRLIGLGTEHIQLIEPLVVAAEDHRFLLTQQVREVGVSLAGVLLEPMASDSAPALTLAALAAVENGDDPVLLVTPADQVVTDPFAFNVAMHVAIRQAEEGDIVILGATPNRPDIGYRYIQAVTAPTPTLIVEKFIENPDEATAKRYLAEGNYFWSTGMFVLKASVWIEAIKNFRSDILAATRTAWTRRTTDSAFVRPSPTEFAGIPSESIDRAVIERCLGSRFSIRMTPIDAGWSAVGDWNALWNLLPKDSCGNVSVGDVLTTDSSDNLVHSSSRLVALVGVRNLVVVETPDAVMVCKQSRSQEVKCIVDTLQKQKRIECNQHRKVHRPWGWYDSVDAGGRFKVKRIHVNPGASLSLQKHHHRAEHWVVVRGTAEISCGEKKLLLTENQSTFIPLGEIHRLANPSNIPLEIIEIQSGSYLGEDDIVRFEDNYGRS